MKFINQLSLLGKFWQEKINGKIFIWNVIFIVLQLVLLFFKFNDLPSSVPLYFSMPWGEAQLASASALFLLPTFSVIIGLIDSLLAFSFFHISPLFSRLLVVFSLIFSILNFIVLYQVINLIS